MKITKKIIISLVVIAFITTAALCKSVTKKSSTSKKSQTYEAGNLSKETPPEKPNGQMPIRLPEGMKNNYK